MPHFGWHGLDGRSGLQARPAATTDAVVYHSRGGLLMYGTDEQVSAALQVLPPGLRPLAVVSDGGQDLAMGQGRSVQAVPGVVLQLAGHLGCFRASAAGAGAALDLGPLSPNGDGLFDLVLDLYQDPLLSHEVPPLGYARTRGTTSGLAGKLEGLARLIGNINKPRYFGFDVALCAHDRQGVPGCRRCLDACPALAIATGKDGIAIDPYLCRGCGSCTLACPTGAVRYARPRPHTSLEQIATALEAQPVRQGATAPVLAIQVGEALAGIPEGTPRLQVPALGSVGLELWFAALALGASRVLIVRSGLLPPTTARLIEEQVDLTWRLLKAIGEAPERVRLVNSPRDLDWNGLVNPWPAADFGPLAKARDKRGLLLAAISHLARHLPERRATVALGQDAPLGTIAIDAQRCTLLPRLRPALSHRGPAQAGGGPGLSGERLRSVRPVRQRLPRARPDRRAPIRPGPGPDRGRGHPQASLGVVLLRRVWRALRIPQPGGGQHRSCPRPPHVSGRRDEALADVYGVPAEGHAGSVRMTSSEDSSMRTYPVWAD